MMHLLHRATTVLANQLAVSLPALSQDWWAEHVVARLSFQQQRLISERGMEDLQQLDFAALLRVLDQNWFELSEHLPLTRDMRTWVKELHAVRNRWVHLGAESVPASEVFRDADTLGRLMAAFKADPALLQAIDDLKEEALATMARQHAITPSTPSPAQGEPRALFKAGDMVALRANPQVLMPVLEVLTGGAETRYRVFHNNSRMTYYESQLQAVAEDPALECIDVSALHAHLTGLKILSPSTTNLFSLRSGRIQFVPYQYRPVIKMMRSDRPRLLIADEVGVGKTIEAGLILKELRARMDLQSVLVVCPKALVSEGKWFKEMKRFDETFTHLTGDLLRHCLRETNLEGEWPEQYHRAILPFSLIDAELLEGRTVRGKVKDMGLLHLDPPPRFDLVIVDEAHHLRNPNTLLHQGVRLLCEHAQAVVFLTATPVQMGKDDLYTLLNLLRPDLVIDRASFEQMTAPNPFIHQAVHHCRAAGPDWQQQALLALTEVTRTEWGRLFLRESPEFQRIYDQLQEPALGDTERVNLTHRIEELYTFGSIINRTRRRDIGEFTTRKAETLEVPFTEAQQELHDSLLDVMQRILTLMHGGQNVNFMLSTLRRQASSCIYGLAPLLEDMLGGKMAVVEGLDDQEDHEVWSFEPVQSLRSAVEDVLSQARTLDSRDPKVERFLKVLEDKNQMENNKVLVFSTFRHTLNYLYGHAQKAGLRVGLIHGDVPEEQRFELRQRFALAKSHPEALDVLLSSEVGSEGLDFQFCDFLVNYDLPWNPMRIEQRIGRIDRYGQQSETVVILNFVTPGTVDHDIYQRCLLRIGVFQHAVGGNEEILGTITREIRDISENFKLSPEQREQRLLQLSDNAIRLVREELELEARQAELFGLNVPQKHWEQELEKVGSFWLTPRGIQGLVEAYLTARLDGNPLQGERALKTLRLSQEARSMLLEDFQKLPRSSDPVRREWERWLRGTQSTLQVTFEQEVAAEHPKAMHLSVVHPLVRQAAQFLNLAEARHVTLRVQAPDLPKGQHPFALYRWSKQGVKPDETLVVVAEEPNLEQALLDLLPEAQDCLEVDPPDQEQMDQLDVRHHTLWSAAQANHRAENHQLVEHRMQSLTASHRARSKAIEDQIARSTHDKITLMKESELARTHGEFERRMGELQRAASSGDIHATPVIFGTVLVEQR